MQKKKTGLHGPAKTGISFLVFCTQRCEPCKEVTLLLPELKKKYENSVFFTRIDDKNIDVLEYYNIINFPTVILFKNGLEVDRIRGVKTFKDYISSIEYSLTHKPTTIDNDDPLYDISML